MRIVTTWRKFHLLLHSYYSGFVIIAIGTISTLFCCVNTNLILFFVDQHRMLV